MSSGIKALIIVLALVIAALTLASLSMKIGQQPSGEQQVQTIGGFGTIEALSTTKEQQSFMMNFDGKTLAVTGFAIVYAEPDRVYLRLAIETDEPYKNATEAYSEVILKAQKIINELKKEEGVVSIKTEYVNLYPMFDYVGGEKVLKGYTASYAFQVEISDLSRAGEIASKAVTLGINRLYGLSFGLSEDKRKSIEKEAIGKAVDDAKAKAEKLAESLGVKIVGVRNVILGTPTTTPYYPVKYYGVTLAVAEVAPPMPIETGKGVAVSATVTVVYEISEE